MTAATLVCEGREAQLEAVQHAARLLREGGVVIFPTETVYGVGVSAARGEAVERLRRVKRRALDQPFTLHVPDPEAIERYVELADQPLLRRLIRKTMPGPITLVVDVEDAVIGRKLRELGLPDEARHRLYHGNTIALRCPADPTAQALLAATGEPVVASSANVAGEEPPIDARQAQRSLGHEADLILDGGAARFGRASTIVRMEGGRPRVLREGVYDQRYLHKLMQQHVLFVCSGNTCRSPMAEAIARHELARRAEGATGPEVELVNVTSAGAFAMPGGPMSGEAEEALRRLGVPVGHHRARGLSLEMLQQADRVYAMGPGHIEAVRQFLPEAAGKTQLLDPAGEAVEDPVGGTLEVYVQCAERLQQLVRARLDELFRARGAPARSGSSSSMKESGH